MPSFTIQAQYRQLLKTSHTIHSTFNRLRFLKVVCLEINDLFISWVGRTCIQSFYCLTKYINSFRLVDITNARFDTLNLTKNMYTNMFKLLCAYKCTVKEIKQSNEE